MKRLLACCLLSIACLGAIGQKKPLDHTVYDSWQHIGEQLISNDGKWVVYTIDPQEGDNELVIESPNVKYKRSIPRGYSALITEDSRFVVFKIKPFFKDTRDARIKKKRPDDMPRDSFAVVELGKENIWKIARVKAYKAPQKGAGWVAYHMEKPIEPPARRPVDGNKKLTDSLNRIIDSLQRIIASIPEKEVSGKDKKNKSKGDYAVETHQYASSHQYASDFADGDDASAPATDAGTDLVLRNLSSGDEKIFNNVLEFFFNKSGDKLLLEQAKNPKDSSSKPTVLLYDIKEKKSIALTRSGNEFKNFVFSDDGAQLAFLAERDARPKELQKFYKVWYYKNGMDSAMMLADKNTVDMKLGMTISEYGNLNFSKTGKRLFFGTAPIQPPRDTTVVDFEVPKVDIWHYNDDYLQTVQNYPARLRAAQQENYLAVYDFDKKEILQIGSKEIPQVIQTNEGDGDVFVGITDYGKRVESQWRGNTLKDIYAINIYTGEKKLIKENLFGAASGSPTGKYIVWYDRRARNYFLWDGEKVKNISEKIKLPLWNEESEVPDEPGNYGVMGFDENDENVFVYDRFDIWKINPTTNTVQQVTNGRIAKTRYRYLRLDPEERFIKKDQRLLFQTLNDVNKHAGLWHVKYDHDKSFTKMMMPLHSDDGHSISQVRKAENADAYTFLMESFTESPDIYYWHNTDEGPDGKRLSAINSQQTQYHWGSAELFKWKAYNGKEATGIVYKPEDFDPKKKYPMIVYFYETLSDGLYDYKEPAPIRSAINVPFFVSRGYVLFLPDIHYTTGHPGKNAYDYIVSGARALVKKGFVDSTKMALQGHSWGGYQAAQVATMTKLFKAIWAGAPVANMTSAYGGIRWESGVSRQFQYERTQSRIGATLWEKPNLYIENSPLFHLDKVTAPMVIMHNDADGAVPWYQGIELFTGLRRLGKKVWMFNYNGQGHGLTQRQDMKDYQIRMQQWFDWILKDEKPAKWIVEGLPAIKKGKEWGLEIVN